MYSKIMTVVILLTSFFYSEAKDYSTTKEVLILGEYGPNNTETLYKCGLKQYAQFNRYLGMIGQDTILLISKIEAREDENENDNDSTIRLSVGESYSISLQLVKIIRLRNLLVESTYDTFNLDTNTRGLTETIELYRIYNTNEYDYWVKHRAKESFWDYIFPARGLDKSMKDKVDIIMLCLLPKKDLKPLCYDIFQKDSIVQNSGDPLANAILIYTSPDIKGNYIRKECLIKKE